MPQGIIGAFLMTALTVGLTMAVLNRIPQTRSLIRTD